MQAVDKVPLSILRIIAVWRACRIGSMSCTCATSAKAHMSLSWPDKSGSLPNRHFVDGPVPANSRGGLRFLWASLR
jgi:hypothetical protein